MITPRVLLPLALLLAMACGPKAPQAPAPRLAPEAPLVVSTAKGQIGTPYRYGGCTPQEGFDCSGFVTWVYAQHGVRLPRTTGGQIRAGWEVALAEVLPADLLFFRTGRRALHVGIHTGQGFFIHSPKSGGRVRVESLTSPYWSKRFIGARRVLYVP